MRFNFNRARHTFPNRKKKYATTNNDSPSYVQQLCAKRSLFFCQTKYTSDFSLLVVKLDCASDKFYTYFLLSNIQYETLTRCNRFAQSYRIVKKRKQEKINRSLDRPSMQRFHGFVVLLYVCRNA